MIISREIFTQIKPLLNSPEAIVITGMRRTGKTTLLNFIYDRIKSANKIYLDLENPVNQKYFEEENYEQIRSSLEILGLDLTRPAYVFLDEIQFIKNVPSVVKYLLDHYQIKFFLTGSASFYLKNLFSESLTGRKYVFELFPLTFREFLSLKEIKLKPPTGKMVITRAIYNTFAPPYDEYLKFGGFPGVVSKKNTAEKKKALEDIFSSYFQLEVRQLGDYKNTRLMRDLLLLLMQRVGSKVDVQKLSSELGVSRPTLYNYLAFLEGTYFIKFIKLFSLSTDVEVRGVGKVYICDSGIINHFARMDEGRLFENIIFQNLRIKGDLNYFQKTKVAEIDFILDKKIAYEVKISPRLSDQKKLQKMSRELGLTKSRIISKNFSQLKGINYGFNI